MRNLIDTLTIRRNSNKIYLIFAAKGNKKLLKKEFYRM